MVSGFPQIERAIKLQKSASTVAYPERASLDILKNILDPTLVNDDAVPAVPAVLADSARIPAVVDEPTQPRVPYPCKFCSNVLYGPPSKLRHEETCKKRPSDTAVVSLPVSDRSIIKGSPKSNSEST